MKYRHLLLTSLFMSVFANKIRYFGGYRINLRTQRSINYGNDDQDENKTYEYYD